MGRISRSFELVQQSYRILMQDKELMVLPLISGTVIIMAVAAFAVGFGVDASKIEARAPELYVPLFLLYVLTYTIPDGVKLNERISVSTSRKGVTIIAPTRLSDK